MARDFIWFTYIFNPIPLNGSLCSDITSSLVFFTYLTNMHTVCACMYVCNSHVSRPMFHAYHLLYRGASLSGEDHLVGQIRFFWSPDTYIYKWFFDAQGCIKND